MNVREQLGHGDISGRGVLLALLLNAAIVCAVRGADDAAKPLVVAADTAIVDVQLPPGAKVIVEGAESTKTRLTYRPIAKGQTRRAEVRVRFRDGKEITRSLLLRGGWHVRLPVKGSGENKLSLVVETGHTNLITSVAFSPDGQRVVTGSHDKTAIVWDARSGQRLRTFQGHADVVTSVKFSPDGKHVLTGSWDNTVILWEARSGQKLRTFQGHTDVVFSVAFSSDGKNILTGSKDKTVILWDARSGDILRTFRGHTLGVWSVAFSPDGKHVLTSSDAKTVTLWDARSGERLRAFRGHANKVLSLAFSSDGKQVVTASLDKTAILWDVRSGQFLRVLRGHTERLLSVAFSPDGKQVVTGSLDKTAILWDAQSGDILRTFQEHSSGVHSVAFSPDGKYVLTGSLDKTAILWDARNGDILRTFQGHVDAVLSLAFSSDGKHVLTGSAAETAILWDAQTGDKLRAFQGDAKGVWSVAFSPDGKHVLTGSASKAPILWDARSGQKLRAFQGHIKPASSVAFSPDGKHVLTGSDDNTAILWDARSGQKFRTFQGHDGTVSSVAFSSDGKYVLTGSLDKTAILWDARSGQKLRTFRGHAGRVSSIAFSSDGKYVLTGSDDKTAILWDARSGEKLHTFQGHAHWVWSVAFSSDGKYVLTGSDDNTAILWDTRTGEKLRTFQGHAGAVTSVAFSPDGKHILTGSRDGTRLWDVATGDELVRLISLDSGRDWLVVTPEGLFDGSADGRQFVSYRIGTGLNFVPVDRFFQDFYRPGLITALFTGERLMPTVVLAKNRPPTLRILSPKDNDGVEDSEVTLKVQAVDEGGGVQGPWLFHNGARVLAAADVHKDGKMVKSRFSVNLIEGDNRLEVKAASADGSWESEPAIITLRYEKKLAKPRLFLVAVGISKYAQGSYRLKYARADAEAIAHLFKERGGILYDDPTPITLLDEHATRDNIRKTLKEVAGKARPQDTLMLFVAGHGAMVGQRYYLLPHDFRLAPGDNSEDAIRKQGIPADVLADFLSQGKALKRMLILDTCASGGATDLFRVASRNPFAFRGEVERLSRSQGIHVLAASAATEEAKEPEQLGHGVLSYTLLAALKAVNQGPLERISVPANRPGQVVDVLEWFAFAAGHVPRLTKEYCGQEQNVHTAGRGSSFPILPLERP